MLVPLGCKHVLTIWCCGLLLGLGGVRDTPDGVAAIGVRTHELCAITLPGQRLQLLQQPSSHIGGPVLQVSTGTEVVYRQVQIQNLCVYSEVLGLLLRTDTELQCLQP